MKAQAKCWSNDCERLTPFGAEIHRRGLPMDALSGLIAGALKTERLVLVRNAEIGSKQELAELARSLIPGRHELLQWEFGEVMELREHASPKNYLFSSEAVPLHWDGAFHRVPSYLVFYCVESSHPAGDGNTIFCNTEKFRRSLSNGEIGGEGQVGAVPPLGDVRLTFETQKVAHYGGSIAVSLFDQHPIDGAPIMRFAEPVTTG
jgi:hypothetical protein